MGWGWRGQACKVRVHDLVKRSGTCCKTRALAISDACRAKWSAAELGVVILSSTWVHRSSCVAKSTVGRKLWNGQRAPLMVCSAYVPKCSWEWPETPALAKFLEETCGVNSKYRSQYFSAFDLGKNGINLHTVSTGPSVYCWLVLTFLRNSSTVPETCKASKGCLIKVTK